MKDWRGLQVQDYRLKVPGTSKKKSFLAETLLMYNEKTKVNTTRMAYRQTGCRKEIHPLLSCFFRTLEEGLAVWLSSLPGRLNYQGLPL